MWTVELICAIAAWFWDQGIPMNRTWQGEESDALLSGLPGLQETLDECEFKHDLFPFHRDEKPAQWLIAPRSNHPTNKEFHRRV